MSQYDRYAKEYMNLRRMMFSENKNSEFYAVLNQLGNIKNKKILDLGSGFGDYVKSYSARGAIVTGIDNSEKFITYAKKRKIKNAQFIKHDISTTFPFPKYNFDIITSTLVFDHIKDINFLFKECRRVLKKEGIMIFAITNPLLYQEKSIVGYFKFLGKSFIFGDYFKRRKIIRRWGGTARMTHFHKTLEDYFDAFLNNGFKLLKFREPYTKSKKSSWHNKNPTFLVFKLIKEKLK